MLDIKRVFLEVVHHGSQKAGNSWGIPGMLCINGLQMP